MNYDIPKQLVPHPGKEKLRYHEESILIVKEMEFDAAHHLYDYDGKCRSLHGHRYILRVGIRARILDENGFVVDFGDIKRMFKDHVEPKLDHRYLNETLPAMNTTAENMVYWIYQQFAARLEYEMQERFAYGNEDGERDVVVDFVRLYETPTAYAEYRPSRTEG